jgi:hypothetical protein
MRARLVMIVLAGASLVVATVGAPAGASTGESARSATDAGRVCASYLTQSSTVGVTSQDFEPANDAFDSVAADDLTVTRKCRARVVVAIGDYGNAPGPADSENVTFYRDGGGQPGRVISTETTVGEDSGGTIEMTLDRPVRLRPGRTYWVSVQINMDFGEGGQWSWWIRTPVEGSLAV